MAWKGGAIVTTSEVEIVSSTVIEVKFTSEAITPEQGAQRQREGAFTARTPAPLRRPYRDVWTRPVCIVSLKDGTSVKLLVGTTYRPFKG